MSGIFDAIFKGNAKAARKNLERFAPPVVPTSGPWCYALTVEIGGHDRLVGVYGTEQRARAALDVLNRKLSVRFLNGEVENRWRWNVERIVLDAVPDEIP